jgi:uncharacterized protein (UPF0332 family)
MSTESEICYEKAVEAAADAQVLLEHGSADGASERAYYAVFNAARAALLFKGKIRGDESHGQIARSFNDQFAKLGLVPRKLGQTLSVAYDLRETASYSRRRHVQRKEIAQIISDVTEFVETIGAMYFNNPEDTDASTL